jgi:hypothetical protein
MELLSVFTLYIVGFATHKSFTARRKAIISVVLSTLVWKPLERATGNVLQRPSEWKNTANSPTFASNYQPSNVEYKKSAAVHVQLQTPGLHVPITANLSHHQDNVKTFSELHGTSQTSIEPTKFLPT